MKSTAIICSAVIAMASLPSIGSEIAQTVSKEQAEAAAVAVLTQVEALRRLRGGDSVGAIELLETSLDSNITILGGNDKLRCGPKIAKIVEGAAEYRRKHPRSSGDPVLNQHVAALLKSCHKGQK